MQIAAEKGLLHFIVFLDVFAYYPLLHRKQDLRFKAAKRIPARLWVRRSIDLLIDCRAHG